MKLKIDEKGNAVLQDGHPVYIHPNGTEAPFDAKEATVKIAQLNQENAQFRTSSKEANDKLALFGDMNPTEATEAIQFKNSLAGKKLWDDESVNSRVEAAIKPLNTQIEALKSEKESLNGELYSERVSKQFAASPFLKEKCLLPPDIAEAYFGKNFKMEGNKVTAFDALGNQIFSTVKPGEPASFEEAIQTLINTHPQKDTFLKASGMNGGGTPQNSGGGGQNKFDNLPPAARIAAAREAGIKE